jgi:hypothetical protein
MFSAECLIAPYFMFCCSVIVIVILEGRQWILDLCAAIWNQQDYITLYVQEWLYIEEM